MRDTSGAKRFDGVLRSAILWSVVAIMVQALPGCRGCIPDPQAAREKKEEEPEKKEKEKPKSDFEPGRIAVLPADASMPNNGVKPGHWYSAAQLLKANNFEFVGQLHATCVDQRGRTHRLERSPYSMEFSRPAVLAKGQTKRLELLYYVPREGKGALLRSQLTRNVGGSPVAVWPYEPMTRLEPHQYHFAVVSRLPDSYGYLKKMPSINPPRDEFQWIGANTDYLVLLPAAAKRSPLPENPLTWTSIAFLLWDDYDPDILSGAQQKALIDWLHWGGQLIISGPRNLDRLRSSFLADYLPALAGETVAVSRQLLDQLDEHWYVDEKVVWSSQDPSDPAPSSLARRPQIVSLKKHASAQFVPRTGRLLVERRVGRGRVVASAFSLADRQFVNRRSFDELFNACILRRGPRHFYLGTDGAVTVRWADSEAQPYEPPPDVRVYPPGRQFQDLDPRAHRQDYEPRRICSLRFFSRDAGKSDSTSGAASNAGSSTASANGLFDSAGYRSDPQSGVAGWSDFSGSASAARNALNQAAGIAVPNATFVFQILAVYLLFLVPVNWGFFRLIGRVEWAWAAAPVIAVVGAVFVVRLAQLDIGFVRSRTEITILETQAEHPRAHVTRYSGLYTSLSTRYGLRFDDDTALSLPFSTDPSEARMRLQRPQTVAFRRTSDVQLSGFRIFSNSTDMVHSEQMHTMKGPLNLAEADQGSPSVINSSEFNLRGVGVLRRTREGDVEVSVIGSLDSGSSELLLFQRSPLADLRQLWDENLTSAGSCPPGELGLRPILEMAIAPRRLRAGDVRLVGWTDQEVPGMEVRPRSSQKTIRTVLVANLRYGPLPSPRGDDEDGKYPEIKALHDRREAARQPGSPFPSRN